MKKLIAVISTVSAIGFAVAIAGTNDMSTSGTSPADQGQSAGTAGSDTAGNMSGSTTGEMAGSSGTVTTTTQKEEKMSGAKTCTDENGVTFYKGKSGFDSCMSKMKKDHKDQMGGTSPSDTGKDTMTHSETTTESSTSN